jgi:hypothetical protein
MDIRSALETNRYWNSQHQFFSERSQKVDRTSRRSELRRGRADYDGLLRDIVSDGIAVVPSYWTEEKCRAGRDELDRLIATYPDAVHFHSGGSDKRMYGVESVSSLLAEFHNDPFLRSFGECLGGLALYNFATLGARIDATPENNGSGDGWHRDAHGFQFKSILYLSDVMDDNGPFEYLPASHKRWRAVFDTAVGDLPAAPKTRYEPTIVDRMVARLRLRRQHYPARAGTLLLVNTAGIHRGRPLRSGCRYALTNYFYHPVQVGESRIQQFSPLMPGTAERVRSDFPE